MLDKRTHDGEVWKGFAAGLAGGLVASFVMNEFQALLQKARQAAAERCASREQSAPQQQGQGQQDGKEGEDATVKTAEAIAEAFGHPLSEEEKKVAGPIVHYAFGAAVGGVYGALAELSPKVSAGAGVPFGTAVWLGADEIAVPALHLAKKPSEHPPSVHAYALASHVVYGLTTEMVRRALVRVL